MSRWLDWIPKKLDASPKTEATKLTKPPADPQKFEKGPGNELTKPTKPTPPPAPDPAPDAAPPLEAAVCFTVPGVGDVWLVADDDAAERLGIPAGQWLTPADLALLEGLEPQERVQVLVWMRETGGRLVAAPSPARRYGPGERGWQRWRIEKLDQQIAEYRRGGRK